MWKELHSPLKKMSGRCFIFNFSTFLSSMWLPASLKVSVSIHSVVVISSWESLYLVSVRHWKSDRLMLNGVTFPSFAPFLFPLGPVFQVHCGTCLQRLYLTPLVFNASPPPHHFKASILPGMWLQTMQREQSQQRSARWCLLSLWSCLFLRTLLIFRYFLPSFPFLVHLCQDD